MGRVWQIPYGDFQGGEGLFEVTRQRFPIGGALTSRFTPAVHKRSHLKSIKPFEIPSVTLTRKKTRARNSRDVVKYINNYQTTSTY